MIELVWGGIGKSKTCFATWLLFVKCLLGWQGCANYSVKWVGVNGEPVYTDLKPVIDIRNSINDIKNLPDGLKYGVIDEVYKSAHSRRSQSNNNMDMSVEMAQSRKFQFHACLTTQRLGKADLDLRDLAEVIYQPFITWRKCNLCGFEGKNNLFGDTSLVICPKCNGIDTAKPIFLNVVRQYVSDPIRSRISYPVALVNPILNIDIPESFDTREYVTGFTQHNVNLNLALLEKYKDSKLSEEDLTAYIKNHEGLKIGDCRCISREIFSNRLKKRF